MDSYDIVNLQNIVRLQNIAYVMTQNTSAQVELNAMLEANQERARKGEASAYGYEQMMSIIDKYQIHHNGVITNLHQGQ